MIDPMEGELYVNTMLLQQHGAEIQQERRVAEQLYEQLRLAQQYASLETAYRYNRLVQQADNLIRYFRAMEDAVDNMSTDFEKFSQRVRIMLEENLYSR